METVVYLVVTAVVTVAAVLVARSDQPSRSGRRGLASARSAGAGSAQERPRARQRPRHGTRRTMSSAPCFVQAPVETNRRTRSASSVLVDETSQRGAATRC
jgi:hypothetical protein